MAPGDHRRIRRTVPPADPSEPSHWVKWHAPYEDPASNLSLRLRTVQAMVRQALDAVPPDHAGPIRIVSLCAGQGRDVIDVVAEHPRRDEVVRAAGRARPGARRLRPGAGRRGRASATWCGSSRATPPCPAGTPTRCRPTWSWCAGSSATSARRDITATVEALPSFCRPGAARRLDAAPPSPRRHAGHPGRLRRGRLHRAGLRGARGDRDDRGPPPLRRGDRPLRPGPPPLRLRGRRVHARMTGAVHARQAVRVRHELHPLELLSMAWRTLRRGAGAGRGARPSSSSASTRCRGRSSPSSPSTISGWSRVAVRVRLRRVDAGPDLLQRHARAAWSARWNATSARSPSARCCGLSRGSASSWPTSSSWSWAASPRWSSWSPASSLDTLFALVGPLINLLGCTVREAFRRSVTLVWPHFVLVFCFVAIPLAVEHEVLVLVHDLVPARSGRAGLPLHLRRQHRVRDRPGPDRGLAGRTAGSWSARAGPGRTLGRRRAA